MISNMKTHTFFFLNGAFHVLDVFNDLYVSDTLIVICNCFYYKICTHSDFSGIFLSNCLCTSRENTRTGDQEVRPNTFVLIMYDVL